MISSASLSAFSLAPMQAALRPQPAAGATLAGAALAALAREPASASSSTLATSPAGTQKPLPGQRLPRGSLLNLSV